MSLARHKVWTTECEDQIFAPMVSPHAVNKSKQNLMNTSHTHLTQSADALPVYTQLAP